MTTDSGNDGLRPCSAAPRYGKAEVKLLNAIHRDGVRYGARRARGFMCKTDFDYEVGNAMGGNKVYPSVRDLKANQGCWKECGIVEVEVSLRRVVAWENYRASAASLSAVDHSNTSTPEGAQ